MAISLRRSIERREERTGWLRLPKRETADPVVKPAPYLPIYEQLLAPLRDQSFTLLELGVWGGDSLQMWRDAFPRATIVGVDLGPPDLQLGPRVHVLRGDQSDAELMRRLREEYAPAGFEVIIDDASHLGVTTARSLQALYSEHLRPGGLYCIEDWGTGYLPDWHDGGRLGEPVSIAGLDGTTVSAPVEQAGPAPMPSHDVGAVGVVKRLVDHAASGTLRLGQPDLVGEVLAIESMTVWDGIVALRKSHA
ncbi:MAG TPA: hypothetical protein VIC06_03955 [Solirubrobacteraceae bacterium]